MGLQTCTVIDETSPVAPARLFQALCLDNQNCMPKVLPQVFKSIDFLKGDSTAVGCIKQINFAEGGPSKYLKSRVDELDANKFYVKYTNFEDGDRNDKLEYSVYEGKLEPLGTGSHYKSTYQYHTKGDAVITEEEIKFIQISMTKTFKTIEQYLIDNPEVYT